MTKRKPELRVVLPNLLLIPSISVVFSVLKVFGLTDWSWIMSILFAPVLSYMVWSLFLVFLTVIVTVLYNR